MSHFSMGYGVPGVDPRVVRRGLALLLMVLTLCTARAATPTVVVILGDSLAAGYGVDPTEAFPALVQKKAESAGLAVSVVNAGVSGDTTAGGVRRLDWLLKRPVDILVIELGGNDGLRGTPVASTRTNLVTMIRKAREKYPSIQVVLAGMQMPPSMGQDYAAEFGHLFESVARTEKTALIPFLLEGVGGIESLNQADQIHPNPQGHQKVAENVWKVLEPLLRAGR
jgi:acyl-CoA thioesterase-1